MIGKTSLFWTVVFLVALLTMFIITPYPGYSAEYETGTTTMNVTVRGFVSISVSSCVTNGISFATQDPGDTDTNATCNNITASGGTGYNLTVDASSTVNINFTHASNRTNLTDGTNTIEINSNLTSHSNSTANNGTNLLDGGTSDALNNTWRPLEECDSLTDNENCWITYFLDIPGTQAPGSYYTGYCWCGRQINTGESNCGTCT